MNIAHKGTYDILFQIYKKYQQRYKHNPDSMQMCCMWSTANPPEIVIDTDPFCDIEDAFEISLDEDDCMELYDMNVEEAASKIADIVNQQG